MNAEFLGALQAAEEGGSTGKLPEKHASGAEARADSAGFMPGMNPRPTTRTSFSAACLAPEGVLRGFLGAMAACSRTKERPGAKARVIETYFQGSKDPCSL